LAVDFLHKWKQVKRIFFFNITEKSANFQKIKVIFKVSALLIVYKEQKILEFALK